MRVEWLNLTVSGVGLLVSVFLLVEALNVRKVALGGAIAEKISYVLLATLCLAASAVASWSANFVRGITLAQTRLAAELLVIVAMALLAAYFYSVRAAMQRFMRSMTGAEHLSSETEASSAEAAAADGDAAAPDGERIGDDADASSGREG